MESVVEDVEDERETEGRPADSQYCEDGGGCDLLLTSSGVDQVDVLYVSHHHQRHHRQTRIESMSIFSVSLFLINLN